MSVDSKFFYANSMEASVSSYDVSLKFARNITVAPKDGLAAKAGEGVESIVAPAETLVVSMSPSHAKAILPTMIRMIQKYEESYGVIPLDSDMKAIWNATFSAKGDPK